MAAKFAAGPEVGYVELEVAVFAERQVLHAGKFPFGVILTVGKESSNRVISLLSLQITSGLTRYHYRPRSGLHIFYIRVFGTFLMPVHYLIVQSMSQ